MGERNFGKERLLRWFCGQNRVTERVEDVESCWDAWEGDELWDVSWVEQGQSRKGELTWLFIVIASRSWTNLCLSELGTLTRMLSSFLFPSSCITIQVSDTQYAKKDHRYESSITCSRRLFLPLFLTLIPEPPQDLTRPEPEPVWGRAPKDGGERPSGWPAASNSRGSF